MRVVEARQQLDERALAGTAAADQRDDLAGRDREVDIAQRQAYLRLAIFGVLWIDLVGEADIAILDQALQRRRLDRARLVLDSGLAIQELADALRAGVHLAEGVPFFDDLLGRLE